MDDDYSTLGNVLAEPDLVLVFREVRALLI